MSAIKETWDVIIVGTGPSGATLAKELARQGKKVLILDKGGSDIGINIPKMLLNSEMMFIGGGKTLVRGVRLGGTSIIYYGTACDPPFALFSSYGIDLEQEVKELKSELPIAVLPDHLIGPCASKVMQSAIALGYKWGKLEKFIFQEQCTPDHFPFEAQWNSLMHLNKAIELGAVLYFGASVNKVLTKYQEAVGVEFVLHGKTRQAFASKIVLAAGGNGSPAILQASGIDKAGNGLFCDPVVVIQGLIDDIPAGNEIPMTTGVFCQEEGFIMTDLTLPKLVYQLFAAQALKLNRIFDHSRTMSIMVKVKDDLSGRVTAKGKVIKHYTELDKRRMDTGINRARKILQHAGAKKIFHTAWTSAHPGGSVRIGELVDSNLETQYKNLFVCDCSVIPTSWGLPPVLTLLALSKRLSKHLVQSPV